jgi:hypothetical protein
VTSTQPSSPTPSHPATTGQVSDAGDRQREEADALRRQREQLSGAEARLRLEQEQLALRQQAAQQELASVQRLRERPAARCLLPP